MTFVIEIGTYFTEVGNFIKYQVGTVLVHY